MNKKRVFELSKELDIPSKDIVQFLQEFGADVKNHMSTVEDHVAVIVKRKFRPEAEPKAAPSAVASPPPDRPRSETRPEPNQSREAFAPRTAGQPAGADRPAISRPGQQPLNATQRSAPPSPRPAGQAPASRPSPGYGGPTQAQRPGGFDGNRDGQRRDMAPASGGQGPRPGQPGQGPRPYAPAQGPRPGYGNQNPRPTGPGPAAPRGPQQGPASRPGQGQTAGYRPQQGGPRPPQAGPRPQGMAPGAGPRPPMQQPGPRPSGPPGRPQSGPRPSDGGLRSHGPAGAGPGPGRAGRPGGAPAAGGDARRGGPTRGDNRSAHGGRPGHGSRPEGMQRRPHGGPRRPQVVQSTVGKLVIGELISVKDLAAAMGLAATEIIRKLMAMGVMATINQEIDFDTAVLMGNEFGVEVVAEGPTLEQQTLEEGEEDPGLLEPRWPVVTVMGHVDHGKTSLLDAIRETKVTAQEAGGITQHIGAYQVEVGSKRITFLDTPGHEAFTAMRARGAQITDIVILVVAADDGVMPQTIEAINHVKAAKIPIIVAINKIDKPGVNPDRVKQELTEYNLVAEEWGGDTIMVAVSAVTREGLDTLLEMILLVAEMQDLRVNPNRPAVGTVIEAQLDKGRGPVATVLVQKGTLNLGDVVLLGSVSGRVRSLVNDKGKRLKKAGPSVPVEVVGLTDLPQAGDVLYVVPEERVARQLAEGRQQKKREQELRQSSRVTLDDLFSRIKEGEVKELAIVVKADVRGSIEPIQGALERLSNDEVRVRVIHTGVGGVTESDIMLASASNAIIIGFNVRPDPLGKRAAEREGVDIRLYRVIYDAINDVKAAMEGMLDPEYREVVVGRAEVRQTFKVPKAGTIAGCFVTEGRIPRSADVRLIRDHIVIHEGKIDSLKRFKDDAREVAQGYECGIGLERFQDIHEGDIIEAFVMEEVKRKSS